MEGTVAFMNVRQKPEYREKMRQLRLSQERPRLLNEYQENCPKCQVCDNDIPFEVWKKNKKRKSCSSLCKNALSKKAALSWERGDAFRETMSKATKKAWRDDPEAFAHILEGRRFSSKGERELRSILKWLFGDDKVKAHRHISLSDGLTRAVDITISHLNCIIEYDGEFHERDIYGNLETVQVKDRMVNEYCKEHGIQLIRVRDDDWNKHKNEMIKRIINGINKQKKVSKSKTIISQLE